MKIAPITFKGYQEEVTVINPIFVDSGVLKTLDNARPYLRQIGNSMPYNRDLYIKFQDDGCDTILSAYDYNKKNRKAKLLAKVTEHTSTEHGLDFVDKVFAGLKKNCSRWQFRNIASEFVTKFRFIQNEQQPLFDEPNKFPIPACWDV